jgi:hypothetical protein
VKAPGFGREFFFEAVAQEGKRGERTGKERERKGSGRRGERRNRAERFGLRRNSFAGLVETNRRVAARQTRA